MTINYKPTWCVEGMVLLLLLVLLEESSESSEIQQFPKNVTAGSEGTLTLLVST